MLAHMLTPIRRRRTRLSHVSRTFLVGPVALIGLAMVPAGPAASATFAAPTLIAGFGDTPALAQVAGATLTPDGSSAVVGTADTQNRRRVVVAQGSAGSPMGPARGVGPASGAYDVAFASNAAGDGAVTFSVGHVAYLTTWHGSRTRTQRVGTSASKPQSAVAVQPKTGRTLVLWRGRSSRGLSRLQWRVATHGKLGRSHTLGELGDTPRVAIDATGTTIAVWLAHGHTGVRTATSRGAEFGRPTTLTSGRAGALRLITSDAGSTVAAWLSGPGSANPEGAAGSIVVATRTASTRFGAPATLGTGSTLSLAGSPDGHALLVTDRHIGGTSVVVSASRRGPTGSFGPLTDVAPAQFVSDAYPAIGAVSDNGRALVTWASAASPSAAAPAGLFAAVAEPSAAFGTPQQVADAQTATLPQPTAGAITSSDAIVAWTGPQGARIARAAG
jgi:hypothetical protein